MAAGDSVTVPGRRVHKVTQQMVVAKSTCLHRLAESASCVAEQPRPALQQHMACGEGKRLEWNPLLYRFDRILDPVKVQEIGSKRDRISH